MISNIGMVMHYQKQRDSSAMSTRTIVIKRFFRGCNFFRFRIAEIDGISGSAVEHHLTLVAMSSSFVKCGTFLVSRNVDV